MKFDTIKLSELAAIQTGPFGSQLHKEDYVVHGTPIVTVEHLGSRKFTEQTVLFFPIKRNNTNILDSIFHKVVL